MATNPAFGQHDTLRLFASLAQTKLGHWLELEIARLQAQLVEQTEVVAIYRIQGEVRALQNMRKLIAVAPEKVRFNTLG
ncbi:MAG: hypothetical protein WC972_12780 [Trueperaceae bacterium]